MQKQRYSQSVDIDCDINMSEGIHLSPLPQDTCESEVDCEKKSSSRNENDTSYLASKNDSFPENYKSPSAESESTEQRVPLTCSGVICRENNNRRTSSLHHTEVTKGSDGGWGWVIVLGAFFITLFLGGVNISFSLLYLEFVDMFNASRAAVGWIGSLHVFMNHFLGTSDTCFFVFL